MTHRRLLMAGLILFAGVATDRTLAVSITEVEPNDTLGTAFDLDGLFSTGANPDIVDAQTIPWVSIAGTGDGTFDYYSFTVNAPGSRGIFDIDYGIGGTQVDFNSFLGLWADNGTALAANDNSGAGVGGGSISTLDSYIDYTFADSGMYVVGVARSFAGATSGGFQNETLVLDPRDTYVLQVSLESATLVPMPGAVWGGLGLIAGFGLLRRRRPAAA